MQGTGPLVTGKLLVSRAGGGGRREEGQVRKGKGGAWPPVLGLLQQLLVPGRQKGHRKTAGQERGKNRPGSELP